MNNARTAFGFYFVWSESDDILFWPSFPAEKIFHNLAHPYTHKHNTHMSTYLPLTQPAPSMRGLSDLTFDFVEECKLTVSVYRFLLLHLLRVASLLGVRAGLFPRH